MNTSSPAIHVSSLHRHCVRPHHSPPPSNRRLHSPPSTARPFRESAAYPSATMAIPRARDHVAAPPPPLPPPTHLPEISGGHDPGWQWGNDPHSPDFGRQAFVKPGSSLLGPARLEKEFGEASSHVLNNHAPNIHDSALGDAASRGSSLSTVTMPRDHDGPETNVTASPREEGGNVSRRPSDNRLHGEQQLGQRILAESSQSYDKHLLSRIGGPNTPKRQSLSYTSNNVQETAQLAHAETERRHHAQLKPLSMPDKAAMTTDSPRTSRWPSTATSASPGSLAFWPEQSDGAGVPRIFRTRHSSLNFEDSISQRGSYDQAMFTHEDIPEDAHMGSLHIHDRGRRLENQPLELKTGTKRQASSPPRTGPRDDRSSLSSSSGQTDMHHRRSFQHFSSKDRLHPSHSSVSSVSSYAIRTGSLGSSLGMPSLASSATSYGSGRLSPNALSPAVDVDLTPGTPYAPATTKVQPTSQLPRAVPENVQPSRKMSTSSATHSRNSSLTGGLQGVHVCECCPKKPKKFDTEDELRLHESEKQYTCAYCPNRFKNKNEAERHQNSLHLRRHSWSCAALSGIDAAFHASSSSNGTDVCGYCGEEFSNPPQSDLRADHLNHVHKIGECNQSKKFFRADHFRQHLKHSHAGTSGKWTNVLENACMKDEPPPEKRSTGATSSSLQPSQIPPKLMVTNHGIFSDGSAETLGDDRRDSR